MAPVRRITRALDPVYEALETGTLPLLVLIDNRKEPMSILWIIVIVLLVLFVLGGFGYSRR